MADTSIKLSGTYDSIEAYRILEEMQNMSTEYEAIKEEAEAASSAATAAVTTAQTAANSASTYAGNAQTYAGNANSSASEAAGYASDASTSATNAASSETNASNSATAAHNSEVAAAASEAVVNGALPLTGGTMTGQIHTNYYKLASQTSNDKYVEIDGGTNANSGASLILFGMDESRGGQFWLSTHNGTTAPRLIGDANGTLTWGNKVLSAESGRLLSASGSMALTQGQYTNLCSVTLKKSISDKWLVTGWSCTTSNSSATLTMALLGISGNTAARYGGAGGGGASLTLAVEISSDLVVYTAVNTTVAGLTGRGVMYAVPIM